MKRPSHHRVLLVLICSLLANSAVAEVTMPPVFADGMVIQRDTQAAVWGWADPGEKVSVVGSWGQTAQAVATDNGHWKVQLQTPPAGGPHTIKVQAINTLTFEDVLSGDVWLCSGQSNMEWMLHQSAGAPEEMASAEMPKLRHFKMPRRWSEKPRERFEGDWLTCSPETAGKFSAVAYYFGKQIVSEQNIPIGLLSINMGGTRIESWTPRAGLLSIPEFRPLIDGLDRMDPTTKAGHEAFADYVEAMKQWIPEAEEHLDARQPSPPMPERPRYPANGTQHDATFLYNGMIDPILPLSIKGVIWYQGEQNGAESRELYRQRMKALVEGWRKEFDQGEFPFYFVQLANFGEPNKSNPAGGDGYARVRQAQLDSLSLANTGMAVAIDVGEARDIHPRNKRDVGLRLARWAMANEYGEDLVPSGPLFSKLRIDGNRAVVSFDYVGTGLMVGKKVGMEPTVEQPGESLKWFAIQGQDKQWHWGDARIEGDEVVVTSPHVSEPRAVRYAYAHNPEGCNLYNREGLPASPFTTEK